MIPNSPPPQPSFRKLLWHWMMGITLGIVFAGVLLHSGSLEAKGLVDGPLSHASTLRVLLTVAFLFGVGATLTGAMFLANDNS
jgi:hypothetical protein